MRIGFLANILLTFIWVALTGNFQFLNFLLGFVFSFVVLWIISSRMGKTKYFKVVPRLILLFLIFNYELIKANIQVAITVVRPRLDMTPGIVRLPLAARTELEITLLANMITLTPGTLSIDVSNDKKVLYVHGMFIRDKDKFIKNIKDNFEKRLLEILR